MPAEKKRTRSHLLNERRYEEKRVRNQTTVLLRLFDSEVEKLDSLRSEGESRQAAIRRLLNNA